MTNHESCLPRRLPLIFSWECQLFISIFFHFIYFFSLPPPTPDSRSLSLWAFVKESVCVVPGSCSVCVLSLSLMSTHSSHCPYLKWPEPHRQIKSQTPPARSAPFSVVCALSGGERLTTIRHLWKDFIRKRYFRAQSPVQSCHFCNLWGIAGQRVLSFLRKSFSMTFPGQHQSNYLKIFLVSKICLHRGWCEAVSFKQNCTVVMWGARTYYSFFWFILYLLWKCECRWSLGSHRRSLQAHITREEIYCRKCWRA